MTFEEFQKKKKEGTLISNGSSMSFEEFKQKKADGTLLNNDSKSNTQDSFKSVNINQFIQDKFLPSENTVQTKAPTVTSNENFTADDVARRMQVKQNRENTQQLIKSEFAKEQEAQRQEQERWDNLSFGQKIVDPFKTAGANIKHSNLGIQESQAWSEYRSKQDAESLAKAEQATKTREEYEKSNDRIGKGNAFTKDFAGYLPQLGGQLLSGLGNAAGGAAAGAGAGAGTALVAGQLGPQVLVPEEIATVPAGAVTGAIWGGRAGYVAGVANYSYDLMAGSAYKNLLDMGIPNEVALELSQDEAIINSLIEGTGAVVDLISLGLGKLASKSSLTVAQKLAQNKLIQAGAAYGMNLISEPMEEMAQEKVSIETEKKAADIAGIERQATEAQDRERIKESGLSALKISAISGGGNVAGNVITNKINDTMTARAEQKQLDQDVKNLQQEYQTRQAMNTYKKLSPYSKYQPAEVDTNISTKDIKPRRGLPEGGKIYVDENGVAVDSRNYVAPSENNVQNGQYSPVNARQVIQNPINQENVEKIENQQKNVAPESPTNDFQEQGKQTILPTQKIQETVNSAKIVGMSDFDIKKATDLHKMLRSGANLKFYDSKNVPAGVDARAINANGFYQDGTVWINKDSKMQVERILGHELTHYGESEQFIKDILDSNLFYDFINDQGFANKAEYKQYLIERKGYKADEVDSEMAAHFTEEVLFGNEESINRLARENRTLAQKILNWLSDLRIKLVGTSQEKELLRIENMYRQAIQKAGNTNTDAQYSIGGTKGWNNLSKTEKYDTDSIGWFKDKNGDLKFEFSDRFFKLKDGIQLYSNKSYKLGDILEHEVLFDAYPQLRKYNVEFEKLKEANGKNINLTKTILLNPETLHSNEDIEKTLLHEIQHAIQKIEGFEGGRNSRHSKLAYYQSLGEIEAADTVERFEREKVDRNYRQKVQPRSSEANPEHPQLQSYLSNRKEADIIKDEKYLSNSERRQKIKDGIDKFFGWEEVNERNNGTDLQLLTQKDKQDSRLLDRGGLNNEENNNKDIELENNETNNETLGQNNSRRRVAGREPAFSLPETDNQGKKLTAEQQEFFKDSKVRDKKGRLIEVYHGSPNEFTVFEKARIKTGATLYANTGDGFYFTDSEAMADKYSKDKVKYTVYLNIKNPLVVENNLTDEAKQMLKDFSKHVIENHPEATNKRFAKYQEFDEDVGQRSGAAIISSVVSEYGNEFTELLKSKGYDGIKSSVTDYEGLGEKYNYIAFEPEQIKNVDNKKPTSNPDIRFSLNDSEGRTLSKEQQEFFKDSKVRDAEGNLKPVYHGTKRADRVGYYFDPAKATSGPMAFFTDDVEIATNYSKSKQDTSISREADTEYDLFKVNGKDLDSYWDSLSPKQKRDIAEKGNNIGFDEDWENVIYGENASEESFGDQYKWRLNREYNGNAIKALYGIWIEDGNLMFEDMAKFKDILNMAGIENVEYLDKFKEEPKVYEVYMNLKNPFITSNINQEIINKLQKASENATIGEQYTADSWDKSNIEPKDWMSMLRDDIKNNTTHSWTIIPDWVTDVLKSEGYDGIQDTGGKYSGLQHNVYIPFYSNQIKETSNTNPTENVDIRYSIDSKEDNTSNARALSRYAQTLQKKHKDIPEHVNLIQKEIDNGNFMHEVIRDKRSLNYAENYIKDNGFEDAVKHWDELMKRGKAVDKDELALGQTIYNLAVENKDTRLVMKMASDLVQEYTEIGRNLQSATLLRKMTPDGRLYALERSVQKINQDLMQKFDDFENIQIPEELADNLLNSETQKQMDKAVEQIQEYIASQIPATWQEKLNSWRYLSMLGNPRTHIRNIVGNAVFVPAVEIKNKVAQAGELFIPKDQRTKATLTKKDSKLLQYAENDFDNNQETIRGESKYDIKAGIQEKRQIYSTKALELARKGNFNLLEQEDKLFLKFRYKRAFAEALKARGITIEQLRENSPETVRKVSEIRSYAISEAQKATYRDASIVASMISRGKRKLLNAANQSSGLAKLGYNVAYLGAEGVMPFTKTPINIVKRGIEYSPVGLLNGIKNAVFDVKSGKVNAAQAIDNIAAGATGTAIAGLGFLLASMGLVNGGEEDKDKEQGLKELKGYQDYSLNIGDKTYTIDWSAPSSIPLFVGVELYNSINSGDETAYLNALKNVAEPVIEMSMLQGINDTLQTMGEDNAIGNIVAKTLTNYLGQYNPTLLGQIARSFDPVRRTTYVDKNIPVPALVQKFIQQQAAKIPGVSRMLPTYKDQFGQEQFTDGVLNRMVQNFTSPGYLKDIKEGTVEKGITELYERTGETKVIPSYASKSLTYNGEKINLTAEQYDTYSKTRGDLSKKGLEGLFNDRYYKGLTDKEKVKVVEAVYDYANEMAKSKVIKGYELEANEQKIQKLQSDGLDFYKYILLKKTADADGNDYTSNEELEKAIKKYGLTRWESIIKEKTTKTKSNALPTLSNQTKKLPTLKK